mmetsp:Transcript_23677/g.36568  ORF Transcript_23677/g.36568 Transcript_23677/m.36568 type:complete len:214 (-) Transcript_23677:1386-2027(-)
MSSFAVQKDSEEEDSFEIINGDNNSSSSSSINHTKAATANTNGNNPDTTAAPFPWQALFDQYGISEYAEKVEPAIGAKSLEDLNMLNSTDETMIDEAATLMSMMMIPKAKFKKALKALDRMDTKNPKNSRTPSGDVTVSKSKAAPTTEVQKEDHEVGDTGASPSPPAECVVVCIDRSYSMKSPFNEQAAWGENATKQKMHMVANLHNAPGWMP